jgi:hypothetical protein
MYLIKLKFLVIVEFIGLADVFFLFSFFYLFSVYHLDVSMCAAPFLTVCLSERKKAMEETCSRLNYQPYNRQQQQQQQLQQQQQQSLENSTDSFMSPSNGGASADMTPAFDSAERGL